MPTENKPAALPPGEPVVYVQFLTDVRTAAGLVAHGKQDKKFAEHLADECARLQVEHFALTVAAANSIPAYEAPETGEKWSLTGDNGSWDYDSLDELLKDNYGHDSDGDGHPASYRPGLYEGGTVYRGIERKDDPARFLPDANDVAERMYENACDSDAGEWVDAYPDLSKAAEAELDIALSPLKAWARKHCQPDFFTIKDSTPHTVTAEDVRRSRKP